MSKYRLKAAYSLVDQLTRQSIAAGYLVSNALWWCRHRQWLHICGVRLPHELPISPCVSVTELITGQSWLNSTHQLNSGTLFPPAVSNVYDAILTGRNAANNVSEGWNNVFATMVGHHHPSLWCLIGALQHDQAMVATALLQNARGQPPAKRCKALGSAQALLTSSAVSAVTAHAVSRTRCVPSDIVSDSSDCLLMNIYRPSYVAVLMNTCTHERLLVCNSNFILLLELCNCSCNCNKLN